MTNLRKNASGADKKSTILNVLEIFARKAQFKKSKFGIEIQKRNFAPSNELKTEKIQKRHDSWKNPTVHHSEFALSKTLEQVWKV